jgi:hypothetical protein
MTKAAAYGIVLGGVVVLVGGILLLVNQNVKKKTAETAIVSMQSKQVPVRDVSKDVDTTGYTWQAAYQVAGKTYTVGETEDESFDPAVKYKICYDPTKPSDGSLARPDVQCGKMF